MPSSPPPPRRILAVKTHALGDVLLVTPALRALRKTFPEARLAFMTCRSMAPVLEGNPHIDDLLLIDDAVFFGRKMFGLIDVVRQIRKKRYDLAAVFQPATTVHALLKMGGIPRIAGLWNGGWNPFLTVKVPWQNRAPRYIADHFADVSRVLGGVIDNTRLDLVLSNDERRFGRQIIHKYGKPVFFVAPAGGANIRDAVKEKRWAPERFAAVADRAAKEFGTATLLVGAPSERPILEATAAHMKTDVTLRADLNLREVFAVLAASKAVLTNDSLPLHVAVALGVPSVTVFGPSDPQSLHPLVPPHVAVAAKAHCSPCYANGPFPKCPEYVCMPNLGVEEVWEAVRKVLI